MQHIVITAKLFKNGNSQTVRLPKSCRFEGDEILLYRAGQRIIIQPKEANWDEFFFSDKKVDRNFMKDCKDAPPQERELF